MVHVIDRSNIGFYRSEIEQHFRIRHDIYVGERRWMALERADGREVDQFDTDDAIYLLALEGDRVIGGTRFVPTLKPHLMADVFPVLANVEGLRRGEDILEWTRIFVVKDRRGPGSKVLHTVLAGMLEYCLREDVRSITVVMETWWLPRFLELDWHVRPLGLPAVIDGMDCVGCEISVTEASWRNTLAFAGIRGSVLSSTRSRLPGDRKPAHA